MSFVKNCWGRCCAATPPPIAPKPLVPAPIPAPNPVPNWGCGAGIGFVLPKKLCVDAGVKLNAGVLAGAAPAVAPPNIDGVLAAPNSGLLAEGVPNGVLCGAAKGLAVVAVFC